VRTSRLVRSIVVAASLAAATLGATLPAAAPAGAAVTYTYTRATSPARTIVKNSSGKVVATFTNGSRTVTLLGPTRTFAEASTTADKVITTTWVRLLPAPFTGTVDAAWVTARLADTSPDVLALGMQYIVGATAISSGGLQIAGDADYGPLQPDGTRQEGSDFNDYLGVTWTYPSGSTDAPEPDQFRSLDCSGYMRMVLGYRGGVPMTIATSGGGTSLPRRAYQQAATGPGIELIANTGVVPSSRSKLLPGDLVFFDASTDDGTQIDHVGMYLGRDTSKHDRFISSRKTANGPTLGDLGGKSILDGTGYYASAFRSARRV